MELDGPRARPTHMALSPPLLLSCLLLCVAGTAAGCGTQGEPQPQVGDWQTERLDFTAGPDQAALLATSGDDAVVVVVTEDGTLRSELSEAGAAFRPGEPLATDQGYLQLADVVRLPDGDWYAMGSGGLVERDGDEELLFEPVAFRSDDGLTWAPVLVAGIVGPVDINDLEVVQGVLVVAGATRNADHPGMGGFQAKVWTSADTVSFTETALPGVPEPRGYRNESYAGHLALTTDRLLLAGRIGDSAALWSADARTSDRTTTWRQVEDTPLAGVYDVSGLAAVGDVALAGLGGGGSSTALRSADQGESWSPVEALSAGSEELGWAPTWSDGERFWTLTGIDDQSWSSPEVCYADLEQCGDNPAPRLVVSADADSWTAVTLPEGEVETIAGTGDGRALVLALDQDGLAVHTLAAGSSPPPAPEPTEPKTVELVTVPKGERPEVGVRYHAPMYLHCGMDWLWFADTSWRRTDDGPEVETGAGDEGRPGWPVAGGMLYGYAELTDADHLNYLIGDDEVIATYRLDPDAPGCD